MNEAQSDDAELISRIAGGEAHACELLYDRYSGLAYGLAYRMLGTPQAAEDVVQEAFLSLWRHPHSYQPDRGSVRSWLLTIVRNRCIDLIRHGKLRDDSSVDFEAVTALLADTHDTWDEVTRNLDARRLRQALATLPSEQRQVLLLAYFKGLTQDEIAQRLGLPLGTVKGRARMALQKLRKQLDERHEAPVPSHTVVTPPWRESPQRDEVLSLAAC